MSKFNIVYGYVYIAAMLQVVAMRRQTYIIVSVLIFLVPYAFCATSYQGARFRLWLEPFVVLAAAATIQRVYARRQFTS